MSVFFPERHRQDPKKRRIALEELTNRDGNWVRDFSVRAESWTVIEHWANEQGYHLVAIKGRKRVYQKGYNEKFYRTLIEIRHEEGRVILTGWIAVGMTLRLLTFFILPNFLPIDATGSRGIRVRRSACRDLNSLLIRLRQPEIANSDSFHLLDLDLTTLGLSGLMLFAVVLVLTRLLTQTEIRPALSYSMLNVLLNRVVMLLGVSSILIFAHHWGIVKFVKKEWAKNTSFLVMGISFWILSIFSLTHTQWQFLEQKFFHSCVVSFESDRCAELINGLDKKQRAILLEKVNLIQKELAQRSSVTNK